MNKLTVSTLVDGVLNSIGISIGAGESRISDVGAVLVDGAT